jgi:hypothetical protein
MGEKANKYNVFVGKSERNRPIERSRHRWSDNIKLNFCPDNILLQNFISVCIPKLYLLVGSGHTMLQGQYF